MANGTDTALFIVLLIMAGSFGVWYTSNDGFSNQSDDALESSDDSVIVTDSNGVKHKFA